MVFLTIADLAPFATIDAVKAQAMVDDASAIASLAAPCLAVEPTALTTAQQGAVKAILRGAILRWNDAGTGALTQSQQTAGSFSVGQSYDNRQSRRNMFWPSEITQLQDICNSDPGGAFSVDTAPGLYGAHLPWCSLYFGALYCSCGVDIAGYPIFEGGLA